MSEDPGCGVPSKPTKRELRELRLMVDNYREGYQKALNDMLQRLDMLAENSEDMDWHRGVEAARFELSSLNWEQLKKERSERRASGGATT